MKSIDQLQSIIAGMGSVFAPVMQTQLETLIAQVKAEQAQGPTLIIHMSGGLITYMSESTPVQVIIADYDTEGCTSTIKQTPEGYDATIEFARVDASTDEAEIAAWVALANQD